MLTVAGIIESTSGGIKFPDGTTQTSASGVDDYGWHGNSTRIKILPRDFVVDDDDQSGSIMVEDDDIYRGLKVSAAGAGHDMVAFVPIPQGYKATNVRVYGRVGGNQINVYEGNISSSSWAFKGVGELNIQLDITDVASTNANYLVIHVVINGDTGDRIYGGYVSITPI